MSETPPAVPRRSPDGQWEWNGTQWIPAQPAPSVQPIAAPATTVDAEPRANTGSPGQANPVSPDGKHQWTGTAWVPVQKKGHLLRNVGIVVGGLILVGIGAALASSGKPVPTTTTASVITPSAQAPSTAKPTAQATAQASAKPSPVAPTLTNQQQNAVRAAENYLSFKAFSRLGLIDQLSSPYGDGYTVHDATVAVDSMKVDWNAQAVLAAKEYLNLMPFSCKGLINQLSSPAGDKFTVAQATYGAHQAGAC